jgi:hypothetical protein
MGAYFNRDFEARLAGLDNLQPYPNHCKDCEHAIKCRDVLSGELCPSCTKQNPPRAFVRGDYIELDWCPRSAESKSPAKVKVNRKADWFAE